MTRFVGVPHTLSFWIKTVQHHLVLSLFCVSLIFLQRIPIFALSNALATISNDLSRAFPFFPSHFCYIMLQTDVWPVPQILHRLSSPSPTQYHSDFMASPTIWWFYFAQWLLFRVCHLALYSDIMRYTKLVSASFLMHIKCPCYHIIQYHTIEILCSVWIYFQNKDLHIVQWNRFHSR